MALKGGLLGAAIGGPTGAMLGLGKGLLKGSKGPADPTIPDVDPETKALQDRFIQDSRKGPEEIEKTFSENTQEVAQKAIGDLPEKQEQQSTALAMDPSMNEAINRKALEGFRSGMTDLSRDLKTKSRMESIDRRNQAAQMLLRNNNVQIQRNQMAIDAFNNKMKARSGIMNALFGTLAVGGIAAAGGFNKQATQEETPAPLSGGSGNAQGIQMSKGPMTMNSGD